MAITVYTGVQGSGKSYEGVLHGILPAIKAGRRVVTNIAGVDSQKIFEYLVDGGCDAKSLGQVIHVTNDDVVQPGFFPGEAVERVRFEVPDWVPSRELLHYSNEYVVNHGKNFTKTAFQLILPELKKLKDSGFDLGSCLIAAAQSEWKGLKAEWFQDKPRGEVFAELPQLGPSLVQPGDLVVIDEAWRFWSDEQKLSAEHMNFFRMHRHYISESGVACDLLMIIQDFASLNRFIRGVCELVLVFTKLKALGLNRYRVDVYEGRPRKTSLTSSSPWQRYDKSIFPLYKSYDGAGGVESKTDARQNLFHNKWFLASMVVGCVFVVGGGKWLYSFVSKLHRGGVSQETSLPVGQVASTEKSNIATDARLVAVLDSSKGDTLVELQLGDGRFVRQRMTAGVIDGWQTVAGYDGRMVGFYFGGVKVK